jgi:hypothetical protein
MRRSKRKETIELPKEDPVRIQYTIPTRKTPEEVPAIKRESLPEPKRRAQ